MAIKYKRIAIVNENSMSYLTTNVNGENKFLVIEINTPYEEINLQEIEKVLRAPISTRFFRLYLLHEDESIKEDITDQVIMSGSLEKTYQQGQTRSLSISLMNPTNIWNPSAVSGRLFANTKFKLQFGIMVNNNIYWRDEGVFVCQDPKLENSDANKSVNIQLFDKFALLDGTISGTTETDYEIPVGTNIYKCVRDLLQQSRDNLGHTYDDKFIIFPEKYKNEKTAYTIKKTADSHIGEILTDIANMLSCDIFYDENGHLTFRDSLDDLDFHNRKTVWNYTNDGLETTGVNREDKWSEIKNRFIIKGSNINGLLSKGIAENTNPMSFYNINGNFGVKAKIIEDNLIYSSMLCKQRAKYELKKNSMKNINVSFSSIYIPHLNPNDLVRWSFKDYGWYNQNFIVQSVSIPLNPNELMSVSITNIEELVLN